MPDAETWIRTTPQGLYVEPGDFHIDPARPVARAVVTHGHGDHARSGHRSVLATAETLAIMQARLGEERGQSRQALRYGETLRIGDVAVRLAPAGHVLGSAQIVLEWRGTRVVVSGDYKRRRDPTCPAFEPQPCDVFVTEATFGLPVYRHPPDRGEVERLLDSVRREPGRAHVVGVYALGKCQRLIRLLREAGWDSPIPVHRTLRPLCALYESAGIALGPLATIDRDSGDLAGAIALAPPSSLGESWLGRLADPVGVAASGWMRLKRHARQRGVELPLIVSDHADWDELLATLRDVGAPDVWVTHGEEDALVHAARGLGIRARALRLIGFDDEGA